MSFLEVVVSSSLMLCRSKNAEKKENPIFIDIYYMYIHVTTSITTMKIKVKCKLTNHFLTKYCLLFNSPNVIRSQFQLAHSVGPSTSHQRRAISKAYCWQAVGGPTLCAFLGCEIPFYFIENIRFGCLKEPSR